MSVSLCDFLAPWPCGQMVLVYDQDPRLSVYHGFAGKILARDCSGWTVVKADFSLNELLVMVQKDARTR